METLIDMGTVINFVAYRVHVEGVNLGKYFKFSNLILHITNLTQQMC
jgi:hypothetical protein